MGYGPEPGKRWSGSLLAKRLKPVMRFDSAPLTSPSTTEFIMMCKFMSFISSGLPSRGFYEAELIELTSLPSAPTYLQIGHFSS